MPTCDVLIVGGGPAGSSCAWALNRAGVDVLVVDRSDFPRNKVCAGWITPHVAAALEIDLDEYGQQRTCQPITAFRVGRIGGRTVQVDYGNPVSYGIRRCEFDHYLLVRSGARLSLGTTVRDVRRSGDTWIVDDRVRAPMLVAAGGHFCPVARLLDDSTARRDPVVVAKEIEFRLDARQGAACPIEPSVPEIYFCKDLAGYGWCFRKGDFLNIGLGREDSHHLSEHVAHFCDWLKRRGRIPADTPSRFSGHAYRLYGHSPRKMLTDGLLAIGDAAGLAYAESGEGIRPAVESGLMAAHVITCAAGDFRRKRLAPYEEMVAERFGPLQSRVGASSMVQSLVRRFAGPTLLASRTFVRHVVLNRWFLHMDQKPYTGDRKVPGPDPANVGGLG